MKKIIMLTFVFFQLIVTQKSSLALYGNSENQNPKNIKSVTTITEVFGDGQKLTAIAVEYDKDIPSLNLSKSTFSVPGRTITAVYANRVAAKTNKGVNGKYVIVELSPTDEGAALFVQKGRSAARSEAKVKIVQTGELLTTDGTKYMADPVAVASTKVVNLVVDDFKQFEFKDPKTGKTLKYNLFIPKNYVKGKVYPLVMFIHDAGVCGDQTDLTLIQGNGAVIWATPSEQTKHECFVLAPQYSKVIVNDQSEITEEGDMTINLINSITSQYSIDKKRIYATGQSMGCMTSIALNVKYPDLFAASFLVAGQWDPTVVAPMAKDKLWIIVSEGDLKAFPGMNAITAVLESSGAKVSRATWNGQSTPAEFAAAVGKMIAEGSAIHYASLKKGTVVPAGMNDNGGSNHVCTWRIAYNIEGIRDWLFKQEK